MNLLRSHGAKGGKRVDAGGGSEFDALLFGIGKRLRWQAGDGGAALADGGGHQVLGERRSHERADGDRTSRFAGDGDVLGVAAEGRDVSPYPLEGGHLVQQTVVAGGVVRGLLRQLGMDEEAEDVGAVLTDTATMPRRAMLSPS